MQKFKKISALFLALMIALSLAAPAFAASEIDRVDITFNANNVVGKSADDYRDYFTYSVNHASYFNDEGRIPLDILDYIADAKLAHDAKMVKDKKYRMTFYLITDTGYSFDSGVKVYVNGIETQNFFIEGGPRALIGISQDVLTADSDKIVKKVNFTFDSDIANKTAWDYKSFCSVSADHSSLFASKDYPAVEVLDCEKSVWLGYDDKFVRGNKYDFCIYSQADEGYFYDENTQVYLNGEKTDSFRTFIGEEGRDVLYVRLSTTVEKQPCWLIRLFRAISNCFRSWFDSQFAK